MKYFLFIPALLSFSVFADVTNSEVKLAKELTAIIDAEAIKRVHPKYPISAAKSGMDGWVQLSFVIEPDGRVSNPVVEDSSGYRGFEKEALKAIKKWQYQPAMENGKAVQQCQNSVQLDFKMVRDKASVSRKFYRLYSQFAEALEEKNDALLSELVPSLQKYKIRTIEESSHLYNILSRYAKHINDQDLALYYLTKAVRFSGAYALFKHKNKQEHISSVGLKVKAGQSAEEVLSKAQKKQFEQADKKLYPLLHEKLIIELDKGKVAAAYRTVQQLLLLDSAKKNYPAYQSQKTLLEELINSGNPIVTSADIKDKNFWHYELLHNQFQFDDIKGRLTKLDVRCRNKRHVYTVNDTSAWKLPNSWQGCSIYVYGEDDTKFNLVEVNSAVLNATGS